MDEMELLMLCNRYGIVYPDKNVRVEDTVRSLCEAIVRLIERLERER